MDREIGMLDLAVVLAENLRLLIWLPLCAGLLALGFTFLMKPTYTATARLLIPLQQQATSAAIAAQLGALAGLVSGTAGIKSPGDQYVALLNSRTVFDAIIRRFDLKVLYGVRYTEDARKKLENKTRLSAGAKDGIISIEVDDYDAARAAHMANAFVDELRSLTNTLAVTEAGQRRLFFETQLKQSRDNLTKSEIALRGSGVSEATLKTVPQAQLETLARLKAQITAQEIKLASMRTYMTESNPELRLAAQELSALRAELAKTEQSSTHGAEGGGAEYIAKFRDFKYHEALFELMAKQYEMARIDEAREGAVLQVVDAAQPPERPSGPNRMVIVAATLAGSLLAAMLWVFAAHGFRSTADEPGAAEKLTRLRDLMRFRRLSR